MFIVFSAVIVDNGDAADAGGEAELIALYSYDELGQLQNKKVGGKTAAQMTNSTGLQSIDYNYNIRCWVQKINRDNFSDNRPACI